MHLGLPPKRRILGVLINALIVIVGLAEVIYPHVFSGAAPGDLSLEMTGTLLVAAGVLISPFILFPCVTNRYPRWVERLPEETVRVLKQMIGAR